MSFPIIRHIKDSGMTIYDFEEKCYISTKMLEEILNIAFANKSFKELPLRTRSKTVKSTVCKALGYPVPKSFRRCKPDFISQDLDVYTQKSNNLQIWNEEICPDRRYAIIKLSNEDRVSKVRVLTGSDIAKYDTTGTITIKHQAILNIGNSKAEIVSEKDTEILRKFLSLPDYRIECLANPTEMPVPGKVLPIHILFKKLKPLIGKSFMDTGVDQERTRGGQLHKLVCSALGYSDFSDSGQFPDIPNQLIEVKLQTSPTIDLGAILPDSKKPIESISLNFPVSPRDVRYVIFYGVIKGGRVQIGNLYMATGQDFFDRFPRMEGNVVNRKLQIPLPGTLFV